MGWTIHTFTNKTANKKSRTTIIRLGEKEREAARINKKRLKINCTECRKYNQIRKIKIF